MLRNFLRWIPAYAGMTLLIFLQPLYAEDDALNLDFTNAPVARILETISELAGTNLVLDQSVLGTMSLHVNHMNWQEALNLVLSNEHLNLTTVGNTWFISDNATKVDNLKAQNEVDQALPLETELIPLRYANGQNLLDVINHDKALLSGRANCLGSADEHFDCDRYSKSFSRGKSGDHATGYSHTTNSH